MIQQRTLELLEFNKVLKCLAAHTVSEPGRESALSLRPGCDLDGIRHENSLFEEARTWLAQSGFHLLDFPSLEPVFKQLERPLNYLDIDLLWALRQVLAQAGQALELLRDAKSGDNSNKTYPLLAGLAFGYSTPHKIMQALARCLSDEGRLKDEASPALSLVRGELRRLHQQCTRKVKEFANTYNIAQYLQDEFMTLSSDRYVLPLKSNFKGRVQGIIHDYSQTGETCYFEPFFLVEINNRLQELKREEREEERKVLRYISSLVRDEEPGVRAQFAFLVRLDLLQAKSALANAMDGCSLELDPQAPLRLFEARHPLLALGVGSAADRGKGNDSGASGKVSDGIDKAGDRRKAYESKNPVHPLTIELLRGQRVLVVSGGNAGGKTVCLKTLGLIALMAHACLPVPVAGGSSLPLFRQIHAFIGDEQSLEDSVSTFTAQIEHLAGIWPGLTNRADPADLAANLSSRRASSQAVNRVESGVNAGQGARQGAEPGAEPGAERGAERGTEPGAEPGTEPGAGRCVGQSLVILDEFGSGTDPAQGAALAQAVLDGLLESGGYAVAATHFPALKAYALGNEGVRAASVLFDPGTKKPLFRLAYDQVGASQALDVARAHGLPESVLKKAEQYLLLDGEDSSALIERLNTLAVEREQELDDLKQEKGKFEERRKRLEERFNKEKQELFKSIQQEAQEVLRQWKDGKIAHKQALKELARTRAGLNASVAPMAAGGAGGAGGAGKSIFAASLNVGQQVFYTPWDKKGELLELDTRRGKARLNMGGVSMWVDMSQLADQAGDGGPLSGKSSGKPPPTLGAAGSSPPKGKGGSQSGITYNTSLNLALTLDVRGKRADVAISELAQFIDSAILSGRHELELVHGRGTGALRREIHLFLKTFPAVKSFHLAPEDQGGDGKTIVELK